ncbi:hypothetical protein RclHR1_11310004 [Rhizophagus clarus]|uniref:Bromo domain-containing protein n=1 Tax=Rhizophagus clarus TaxID=94130 RepID=A0A2Z6Q460_9GLOM|nr:hypothetical protein RclHR1_11310004 [Rhizophagus clarus]
MSTSNNYPGQNILISYLKKRGNKSSYYGFLNLHYDTIATSMILDNWNDLNNAWISHFIKEVEMLGLNHEALKEKSVKAPTKVDLSKAFQPDFYKKTNKNIEFTNFCYGILHELESKTCAHPFYKYVKSNKDIKYPIDLFTINSKLKNNQYTSLSEFEEDIRQIFCNCYTYNNVEIKQKGDLKRVRDDTDTDNLSTEQNKDNLVYKQVVDNALLIASSYESLVNGDIIPFIDILKTFLLTRSRMSLSTADEPVLQAIVEYFLPLKYYIPELSLVMNAKKPKGSGRFGFSDIFVLKRIENNNYISLELKYISLNGLIKNQKNNYGANDLENLDKILEKENEETLLKRPYTYWSKEHQKTNKTTIEEILNNGIDQLKVYMNTISKGKPVNYSSSGVFDERIKTTKSENNNYISLELKYISLNGLIKNQKNNYGANDLENLDKILEKENEETLLKRPYTYWSKEHQKTNKTTIEEILNNGIDQLKVYMNTISKGKPVNYSSSGVFDERIKTTKSGNPHKLKGFVILAVGFRRILWRSVEEVISNYIYDRI